MTPRPDMPEHKDSWRIRGTKRQTQVAASVLRKPLTPAEQRLWQALRNRQLSGLKFRRQHAVGAYILDFYCPACKLVVELDGDIHDKQLEYDRTRTEHMALYGYRVIRFRNEEVLNDLGSVLKKIAKALTPGPSPNPGRGES